MTPCRCAYCGEWAEDPVPLNWVVTGNGEPERGSMNLCGPCSRSWCLPGAPAQANAPNEPPPEPDSGELQAG
jgi:hypothetical protein